MLIVTLEYPVARGSLQHLILLHRADQDTSTPLDYYWNTYCVQVHPSEEPDCWDNEAAADTVHQHHQGIILESQPCCGPLSPPTVAGCPAPGVPFGSIRGCTAAALLT
ncbi:hypothetical protein VTN02DRAFT_3421 [Thermoascus thermophilus]